MKNTFLVLLILATFSVSHAGFYYFPETVDGVTGISIYSDIPLERYDIGLKIPGGTEQLSADNLQFNPEFIWDFPAKIVYATETEIRITASQLFSPAKPAGLLCSGIGYTGGLNLMNPFPPVIIDYAIPEPMTLVLMGLGGLLLRRSK